MKSVCEITRGIPTPSYVIDEEKLERNLEKLFRVKEKSGCKILLAQKAFSAFALYPLIARYLDGAASSGLFEARLAAEEMGKEVHVYSPAYKEKDLCGLLGICDHIVFNSFSQLEKYRPLWEKSGVSAGIRINPEHSTQEKAIYDPCAPLSRLGVTEKNFHLELLGGVEGFHIHTLCEQNSDALTETFAAFEKKFGKYLSKLKWINLGGGHHITKDNYGTDALIGLIGRIREKYGLEVYLEPGEAAALGAGYLVCEVLDIVDNGGKTLILDASAACHMPDVIEMPYTPPLEGATAGNGGKYGYRLSSNTCLAGDITGDYTFGREIGIGDRLCFEDMAIYTMVKNNTFNGIPLPSIYLLQKDKKIRLIKEFGYSDFKSRLS